MLSLIERRKEILQLAESDGNVDVEALAAKFGVSTVTIRKDLNSLSGKGLIVRSRGGAVASTRLTRELSVQEKYKENLAVKRRLGRAVADLLGADVSSVAIDSGTTTEEVAHCLTGRSNLTVLTNGLNIAMALASAKGIEVLVTGGTLRRKSMSFYGRQAESSLRHMHFDRLILGVDGIDGKAGITTYFEQEASLNRAMCNVASEIIAVTDSSKLNRRGSHVICKLADVDTLVTDANAPQEFLDLLAANGVKVHVVGP